MRDFGREHAPTDHRYRGANHVAQRRSDGHSERVFVGGELGAGGGGMGQMMDRSQEREGASGRKIECPKVVGNRDQTNGV